MKKIKILIALIIMLLPRLCFAALSAGVQWDVQSGGNANNGGGYSTGGTDYSQATSPHLTVTDLAINASDATIVSSSATPFDVNDVGNILNITAGTNFTAGRYEVISVDGSANATLDRAAGTVASTGGTAYEGGCIDTLTDAFLEICVPGNTVHVKTGTYSVAAVAIAAAGTAPLPITIRGYKTSHSDVCNQTDRPIIALTSTNVFTLTGAYWNGKNLIFTCAGTNGITQSTTGLMINCKSTNTGSGARAYRGGNFINCEAIAATGIGFNCTSAGVMSGCYAHDSTTGFSLIASTNMVGCVADTCTTGILFGAAGGGIINSTIYGCTTGVNFADYGNNRLMNSIISTCTTGVSNTSVNQLSNYINYNVYNGNSADTSNATKGLQDITADPLLTDPANGDFTLLTGSPTLNTAIQFGANVGAVGTYNLNIGVCQDDVDNTGATEHSFAGMLY